jgi:hypothetical protein
MVDIILSSLLAMRDQRGVPRNKDQKVVIVTREELCSLAAQGRMPAMSLAAFFIAVYR